MYDLEGLRAGPKTNKIPHTSTSNPPGLHRKAENLEAPKKPQILNLAVGFLQAQALSSPASRSELAADLVGRLW